MPIGVPELLIVLVILLLIFGPKRLPGLGRQLGGGLREFKDSVTRRAGDDEDERPELDAASTEPEAPPVAAPADRETAADERPPAAS